MSKKKTVERVDVNRIISRPKIPLEDIAWAAFRMLMQCDSEVTIDEKARSKFNIIISHIMNLPFKERKQFVDTWLNASYIYDGKNPLYFVGEDSEDFLKRVFKDKN